ncbi:MAG: hypothetical protein AAB896_01485 [Patescibacteria group bacterium]
MTTPPFENLRHAEIPAEYTSRGTGELVPIREAVVLDFMPRLIGSRFMIDGKLRANLHRRSESRPFLFLEDAYSILAEDELKDGNLTGALEAYKRALDSATRFVNFISMLGEGTLLNPEELSRLNLDQSFGALEATLMDAVLDQGTELAFDPKAYSDFVQDARLKKKRSLQLNQLFFFGSSRAYEHLEAMAGDAAIGKEYMELCVEMGDFGHAAMMAKELGLSDEEARLRELDEQKQEDPKVKEYMDKLFDDYVAEHDRGWF